jgi:hypothetical protein
MKSEDRKAAKEREFWPISKHVFSVSGFMGMSEERKTGLSSVNVQINMARRKPRAAKIRSRKSGPRVGKKTIPDRRPASKWGT